VIGYVPGHGPFHRAHPQTAFTVAALLGASSFVLPRPWGPVAAAATAVALVLIERIPSALRAATVLAAPFWLFLGIVHGIVRDDPATAVAIASRLTAIIFAFTVAIASVEPSRLVEAMVAKGVPFTATFLVSSTVQAVPRFTNRVRTILDAQRCRGLRVRGGVFQRARALVYLALPLVLGSLAELDERTVALDTRGARAGIHRTSLRPPSDTWIDRAVRWGGVVALAVLIVIRFVP